MTNRSPSADPGIDRARAINVGVIVYDDQQATLPCVIKERTADGARIQVESPYNLPTGFVLYIENIGFTAECKVIWRDPSEVGVQFLTTSENMSDAQNKASAWTAEPTVFGLRTPKKSGGAKEKQSAQPEPAKAKSRPAAPQTGELEQPAPEPAAAKRKATTSKQDETEVARSKRPQTRQAASKEKPAASLAREATSANRQSVSFVKQAPSKGKQSAPFIRQPAPEAKPTAVRPKKPKAATPLDQQLALDAQHLVLEVEHATDDQPPSQTQFTSLQRMANQARMAALQQEMNQAQKAAEDQAPQTELQIAAAKARQAALQQEINQVRQGVSESVSLDAPPSPLQNAASQARQAASQNAAAPRPAATQTPPSALQLAAAQAREAALQSTAAQTSSPQAPLTALQLAAAEARRVALQNAGYQHATPQGSARQPAPQTRQPGAPSTLVVPRPKNLRTSGPILIADDDPDDRLMMQDAFHECEERPQIEFVRDGQELLDYLNGEEEYFGKPWPSLILLDLNMPRMDGRAALVKIKGHETWRSIPVIILTTSNADLDIERTYSLGASSFIQKPSSFIELVDMTQSLVKFRSTYALVGQ